LKHENYKFYKKEHDLGKYEHLEYFPASIIEKTDPQGTTHDDVRIFTETKRNADLDIPEDSFIIELQRVGKSDEDDTHDGTTRHPGPIMEFCITMYQEEWYQILQSVAGCIRSVLELEKIDPIKYRQDKFAITLIAGKLSPLTL
jgi:hypothetical protein